MSRRDLAGHSAGRTLAAIVGAPVCALVVGAGLAALPGPAELTFAVGLQAIVPLAVVLGCLLPLAPSGRAAWGACVLLAAPFLLLLVLGGPS